jgi:hypothetical protein
MMDSDSSGHLPAGQYNFFAASICTCREKVAGMKNRNANGS